MPQILIILIAALAPVAWGTTFFVTTEFLPEKAAFWIGFWRAFPIGLIWVLAIRKLPRGEWWWKILILSACNVGLFFPALFISAYLLPGGLGTMLVAFQPIFLALLVWFWLGRKPKWQTWLAISLGVLGISLVVFEPHINSWGLLSSFVAVILFTVGTVLLEKWGVMDNNLGAYTAWQLLLGSLMILPLAFIIDGPCPSFMFEKSGVENAPLYAMIFMAFVNTGFAYFVWFWALERLSLITVSMLGLLGPIVAYALDVFCLGLEIKGVEYIGVALVLTGVAYQSVIGAKKNKEPRMDSDEHR